MISSFYKKRLLLLGAGLFFLNSCAGIPFYTLGSQRGSEGKFPLERMAEAVIYKGENIEKMILHVPLEKTKGLQFTRRGDWYVMDRKIADAPPYAVKKDVDHDGRMDLVFYNKGGEEEGVLFGRGDDYFMNGEMEDSYKKHKFEILSVHIPALEEQVSMLQKEIKGYKGQIDRIDSKIGPAREVAETAGRKSPLDDMAEAGIYRGDDDIEKMILHIYSDGKERLAFTKHGRKYVLDGKYALGKNIAPSLSYAVMKDVDDDGRQDMVFYTADGEEAGVLFGMGKDLFMNGARHDFYRKHYPKKIK